VNSYKRNDFTVVNVCVLVAF